MQRRQRPLLWGPKSPAHVARSLRLTRTIGELPCYFGPARFKFSYELPDVIVCGVGHPGRYQRVDLAAQVPGNAATTGKWLRCQAGDNISSARRRRTPESTLGVWGRNNLEGMQVHAAHYGASSGIGRASGRPTCYCVLLALPPRALQTQFCSTSSNNVASTAFADTVLCCYHFVDTSLACIEQSCDLTEDLLIANWALFFKPPLEVAYVRTRIEYSFVQGRLTRISAIGVGS